MLYRVKVKPTPRFRIEGFNIDIYRHICSCTNGLYLIEFNTEKPMMFRDITSGTVYDLSRTIIGINRLFLKEALESFTQLPFTDTPTSDDTELLEYFLEKFVLTRDKVRQQIANNKKRKAIEAKIKELEKEYNEIGV
jgi:hypothetical protein